MLIYAPFQPGIEGDTNRCTQQKVLVDSLNQNFILFYQMNINVLLDDVVSILPDGCVEILFYCNPNKPFACIDGSVLKNENINFYNEYEYFGVRILPDQAIKIIDLPLSEIINKRISLEEIDPKYTFLIEKICEAKTFQKRVDIFTSFFLNNEKNEMIHPFIEYAIKKIYSTKGNISIDKIVEDVGYSNRHLRKKFNELVGMSPKFFCQVVRFQYALHLISKNKNCKIWDIIDEAGYYDQAHFIKEFKKFHIVTPIKYRNNLS
ncbi:helix-turn-helix domain-containing protein [Domibacillus robiginosus]|uniref:helix-turn-helix domain-containing protein n=1 Tax=Domibacillus robiginosus TaxID=1071054 RepID=UPI00067B079E|nr:helix-turn-helix domain-containing protein [Domibacillus robiginosus]